MAITKSLIFSGIKIQDATSTASNTYTFHDMGEVSVEITPTAKQVDDNQTFTTFYDISVSAVGYNASLLTDPFVYSDSAKEPVKGNITFVAATGATNIHVNTVIINANQTFNERRGIQITATKRATNVQNIAIFN